MGETSAIQDIQARYIYDIRAFESPVVGPLLWHHYTESTSLQSQIERSLGDPRFVSDLSLSISAVGERLNVFQRDLYLNMDNTLFVAGGYSHNLTHMLLQEVAYKTPNQTLKELINETYILSPYDNAALSVSLGNAPLSKDFQRNTKGKGYILEFDDRAKRGVKAEDTVMNLNRRGFRSFFTVFAAPFRSPAAFEAAASRLFIGNSSKRLQEGVDALSMLLGKYGLLQDKGMLSPTDKSVIVDFDQLHPLHQKALAVSNDYVWELANLLRAQ